MASNNLSPKLFYAITAGRLIVLIVLLAVTLVLGDTFNITPRTFLGLSLLFAFAFAVTVLAIIWYKKRRLTPVFTYCYILTDCLLVTGALFFTGGVESPLVFLYMLVILSSGFFEHTLGPSVSAIASTASFAILAAYSARGEILAQKVVLTFFLNMAAFWLSALLGSLMAKRILTTREEMEELQSIQDCLVDSLSSGLILTDKGGKVILMNRAGRKILRGNCTCKEGAPLKECCQPLWDFIGRIQSAPSLNMRGEIVLKGHRGEEMFLGLSYFPLLKAPEKAVAKGDKPGDVLGHGIIFQDITSIKEQERRLLRMDRLAALGQMAAGLAHELKNPLASMSGAAQFLARSQGVDEASKRLLEIIQREAERLNQLAESFLLYARPERSLSEGFSDPRVVIEEVLGLVQRKSGAANVAIETVFKGHTKVAVSQGPLKQVVMNLLLNAMEAIGDKGGRIKIEVSQRGDHKVDLIVEDSGVGMGPEEMEKALDPFFTTKPSGTGLGLPIVHSIVQSWDGSMDLWSEKGKGTRVTVSLPSFEC